MLSSLVSRDILLWVSIDKTLQLDFSVFFTLYLNYTPTMANYLTQKIIIYLTYKALYNLLWLQKPYFKI